ncbi:MAG: GrpB family protein [Planctomycetes bacterium]|nr:GrpB family protein [Planctomycetota bacterium]
MTHERIVIHDHDPAWAQCYAEESRLIAARIGALIHAIHHVGSTSVAGLAAKPIIDIAIESHAYPPGARNVAALSSLEYVHDGESGVPGRHFFRKGTPRRFHLHWCPVGGAVVQSQLAFKGALIRRPDLAARYADVKRSLAGRYTIDRADYVAAKEPIILEILGSG